MEQEIKINKLGESVPEVFGIREERANELSKTIFDAYVLPDEIDEKEVLANLCNVAETLQEHAFCFYIAGLIKSNAKAYRRRVRRDPNWKTFGKPQRAEA